MAKLSKFAGTRRSALAACFALASGITVLCVDHADAQTLAAVKSRNKVIVGIQGENPPWGFISSQGKYEGFDADVAELFGKELGVPVEFVAVTNNNRIPALQTGRVDILFSTLAMLPDRAKALQFSQPYAANELMVVGAKTTPISKPEDLAKLSVGVPKGSAQETQITKMAPSGTDIRHFDDDSATIQAILSGQVQAVGANQFYLRRLDEQKPGVFDKKFSLSVLYNGAGTRLGDKEWNATVNAFLTKIKSNGDLNKIYQKWMGFPAPAFPDKLDGIPFVSN